ncbi:MAG: hypothetical protein FJW35_02575 [Acidobacteria bacterium]|nr:hypothetical protein [Acidobacteriota bacterium]
MNFLEHSRKLGRKIIRAEKLSGHGVNTYSKLKTLIREGRSEEALAMVDYLHIEGKGLHDLYCDWTYADLDYVAGKYGEEEVYHILRYAKQVLSKVFYGRVPQLTVEETVVFFAEAMRAHRTGPKELGDFVLREEPDRYVMEFDPCGSGGRMRRVGEVDQTPPRTGPPLNLGRTQQAYPWTWGKSGVPYYCIHCCVWHEIMAIEAQGYPTKITEYSDDPAVPCVWLFYKKPELIPEEYFTRIGMRKDPSRFSK